MTDAVVEVGNQTSRALFVRGDPNWDDQVLMIEGERLHAYRGLAPGASVNVAVPQACDGAADANLLGLIVADGTKVDYGPAAGYQMTIGHGAETGMLGITDEHRIRRPAIRYAATSDGPCAMKMTFMDGAENVHGAEPVDTRAGRVPLTF